MRRCLLRLSLFLKNIRFKWSVIREERSTEILSTTFSFVNLRTTCVGNMKILGRKVIPPLFNVLTRWRFFFADLIQRLKLLPCIELHLRWNVFMARAKSMTISTKRGKAILLMKSSKWKIVSNLKSGFHRLERTVVVKASLVGRKKSSPSSRSEKLYVWLCISCSVVY
jgi:hypothetical protein